MSDMSCEKGGRFLVDSSAYHKKARKEMTFYYIGELNWYLLDILYSVL